MLTPLTPRSEPAARLLRLFRVLPAAERETLLAFAEFLVDRAGGVDEAGALEPEPNPEPRPEDERVVAAIKRLSRGYPMLDRAAMLEETSALMSEHVLQGRPASAVIDDLEALFERHYQQLRAAAPVQD
ncbi:hypothetical protein MARPU_12270 [Marichromatium purpuratum 984]|uniref:Crp/Fnr family transcriptional regulator n=1 Tax=Marichromatium purpuratum 984 TaxID=765910 RepID=W0E5P0_MARPU|nr:hypothetical protein [Marichromatium purpuratum]AHF04529.1 hypothetical protein MARPU_12270 [Marichromatium purpuratum 984]